MQEIKKCNDLRGEGLFGNTTQRLGRLGAKQPPNLHTIGKPWGFPSSFPKVRLATCLCHLSSLLQHCPLFRLLKNFATTVASDIIVDFVTFLFSLMPWLSVKNTFGILVLQRDEGQLGISTVAVFWRKPSWRNLSCHSVVNKNMVSMCYYYLSSIKKYCIALLLWLSVVSKYPHAFFLHM